MIFYYASQIRNVSIFYIVLRMSCVESYYQEHEHACAYYHTVLLLTNYCTRQTSPSTRSNAYLGLLAPTTGYDDTVMIQQYGGTVLWWYYCTIPVVVVSSYQQQQYHNTIPYPPVQYCTTQQQHYEYDDITVSYSNTPSSSVV